MSVSNLNPSWCPARPYSICLGGVLVSMAVAATQPSCV